MGDHWRSWHEDWPSRRRGVGCPLCGRSQVEDDEWGTRVFLGDAVVAFMSKTGVVPGYVVAIWAGRHVAEPTELSTVEMTDYWREITAVGGAVERCFEHAKMNYLTLGNGVPHLHTHIVPRPLIDPAPHEPLPFRFLDGGRQDELQVRENARRVRQAISGHGLPVQDP